MHCVKSICIRSYSGPHFFPHFPALGLNTERYAVSLCIQSECGKILEKADQNNSEYGHILRSGIVEGYFVIRLFSLLKLFNNKDNKYRNIYFFAFCEKSCNDF